MTFDTCEYYLVPEDQKIGRYYWKDLVKITEIRNAYCLYIAKNKAHIIPKRVFTDAEDKKEMMKTLVHDCRNFKT